MPKLSSETVTLLDGDIRVFKRPRSRAWQATFKMDGRWVRVSTNCKLVLTRLRSGLPTHLCGLSLECQGAFSTQ